MSICAPKPFGSKFLKGGYSYWPLWWYGQKSKLHDMSGHGFDLTPSGAYFDGQGYYFDGSNDYLVDAGGRKVLSEYTQGSWHSVYLTEGEVPVEGSVRGTGTRLVFSNDFSSPQITGSLVLHSEYCPNLTYLECRRNLLTTIKLYKLPSLTVVDCNSNILTASNFNLYGLTSLQSLYCYYNPLGSLDVTGLTSLQNLYCYNNQLVFLDVSAVSTLKYLFCYNNYMNQDMVDTVLCDMDSHGTSNGTLNISGNEAPSATGVACKDNLVARGWSVTTD